MFSPQSNIRQDSDDEAHLVYTSLAQNYKNVVAALPRPAPPAKLYLQIGNEPNLCGEWMCSGGGWLSMQVSLFFRCLSS